MKKINEKTAQFYLSKSQRIMLRQARDSRIRLNTKKKLKLKSRKAKRFKTITIRFPSVLRMLDEKQRNELLNLIKDATNVLKSGHTLKLDFSKTKELHPCGTLVFLANFDVWYGTYPNKILGTYPEDVVSEELLQHFGIIAKLGLAERQREITHERVRFWHYKSGSIVDSASYRDLAVTVRDNMDHPESELFADCLNEAVANSVGHAYHFERASLPPPSFRKWWLVSSLRDNHAFVAIYDMGVSIPISLRRKPEWQDYLKLRRFKDRSLIKAAVSSLRTSTKLPHRGKGLPEMLDFSRDLAVGGYLSIGSGHGAYQYNVESGSEVSRTLKCPIPGTLIMWRIPFHEKN